MAQIIFFIFVGALALFLISSVIIVLHFLHYRLKGDKHRGMIVAFCVVSLILFSLELIALLSTDWNGINEITNSYFFKNSL